MCVSADVCYFTLLYFTLAISYRRSCPCQIQFWSQNLTAGGPVQGRQVRRCPPKTPLFVSQISLFGPKWPRNPFKMAKGGEKVCTLHVRFDFVITKSPLLPSNSKICRRNAPKMAKHGPNLCSLCQTAPKPRTGRILGYVAQIRIPTAPNQPATSHGFQASKLPNERPRPRYRRARGGAGGQSGPAHGGGQLCVHQGPRGKKTIFSNVAPRPLGMLKQMILALFEPIVTRFGPLKMPKYPENAPFWDEKWFQNGSKTHFPTIVRRPFGMLEQLFFTL